MKKLTKKQTLELCKVNKDNHNRVKKQLCKCICCQEDEEPIILFNSFMGCEVGVYNCNGRCVSTPTFCNTFYTDGEVLVLEDSRNFPEEGKIAYFDEGITPIVNSIIQLDGCSAFYTDSEGVITYYIC